MLYRGPDATLHVNDSKYFAKRAIAEARAIFAYKTTVRHFFYGTFDFHRL